MCSGFFLFLCFVEICRWESAARAHDVCSAPHESFKSTPGQTSTAIPVDRDIPVSEYWLRFPQLGAAAGGGIYLLSLIAFFCLHAAFRNTPSSVFKIAPRFKLRYSASCKQCRMLCVGDSLMLHWSASFLNPLVLVSAHLLWSMFGVVYTFISGSETNGFRHSKMPQPVLLPLRCVTP